MATPQRLPAEDQRVDVVFSAVLIVPFLVLLIAAGLEAEVRVRRAA